MVRTTPSRRRTTTTRTPAAASQTPDAEPTPLVHQLRVTLLDSQPPIWRQVQVASDISLYKLHQILQVVMGWTNSHLYTFRVGPRSYGDPDPELGFTNARRTKLSSVAPQPGSQFIYEYDFGDGWDHQIVVEATLPPQPSVRYPVCLAGAQACPPAVARYTCAMEMLTVPLPDVRRASPACAARPSRAEQLYALRQQQLALLEEHAAQ